MLGFLKHTHGTARSQCRTKFTNGFLKDCRPSVSFKHFQKFYRLRWHRILLHYSLFWSLERFSSIHTYQRVARYGTDKFSRGLRNTFFFKWTSHSASAWGGGAVCQTWLTDWYDTVSSTAGEAGFAPAFTGAPAGMPNRILGETYVQQWTSFVCNDDVDQVRLGAKSNTSVPVDVHRAFHSYKCVSLQLYVMWST